MAGAALVLAPARAKAPGGGALAPGRATAGGKLVLVAARARAGGRLVLTPGRESGAWFVFASARVAAARQRKPGQCGAASRRETGRSAGELVEDAIAGYFNEVGELSSTLDRRYDELVSGKVQLVDGADAYQLLKERVTARRKSIA